MYPSTLGSTLAGFVQFVGTSLILLGTQKDDISLQFSAISGIQLNAFNMTLRKKRIIGGRTSQISYSCMLLLGMYLLVFRRFAEDPPEGMFEPRFQYLYLASISYFARRFLHCSRFVSWTIGLLAMEAAEKQLGLFV